MTTPNPTHVAAIVRLLADGNPRSAATIDRETKINDLAAVWAALQEARRFARAGVQQQHSNVPGGGSVNQDLWRIAP